MAARQFESPDKESTLKKFFLVLTLGAVTAGTQAQTVVYDSLVGREVIVVTQLLGTEWADGVHFAGTDRSITRFEVFLANLGAGTENVDITINFFEGGDNSGTTDPGALIWTSGPINTNVLQGIAVYGFAIPNVVVPDELTWSMEFENIVEPRWFGIGVIDVAPAVGTTATGHWHRAPPDPDWFWWDPVPPSATGRSPVTSDARSTGWPAPAGSTPRFVRAPAASEAPVPPSATGRSFFTSAARSTGCKLSRAATSPDCP